MRLAAFSSALVLGFTVLAVAAAQAPSRATLTGKISVIKLKTLTVHGNRTLTCRITRATPNVHARGFQIGNVVKITCKKGILAAINLAPRPVPATVTPTGTTTTDDTLPSDPPGGTGGVKTAPTVNGAGNITALGSGQIEFANSIDCQLTSNSPSTAGYHVGSRVSYTCVAGSLTKISSSEAT